MNIKYILLAILVQMATSLPEICESAEITVYGTVTYYENQPVPGAKLTFYSDSGDTVTTFSDDEGNYSAVLRHDSSVNSQKPQEITLLQNYPNPFNPSTTIEFILGKPSYISLDIYNITGQKIMTLAEGFTAAGNHIYSWDGTDIKGKGVSSGIYIYTLRSDAFLKSGRMTLLDGHSAGVSSHSTTVQHSAKQAEIIYIIIEKEGFETLVVNRFSLSEGPQTKDFRMNPHDFFPIETGNEWKFMQSDSDSFEYINGQPSVKVESDSLIGGKNYFLMVQDWNKTIPDSMLIRREKDKIYRYVSGSDWVIYDFASTAGSSWKFPLSISTESDTAWVEVEKLDTSKIDSRVPTLHSFFKFTVEKTGECWYEIYFLNLGLSTFRFYEYSTGKWNIGFTEQFKVFGRHINCSIDLPGLINYLHRAFDGL